MMNPRFCFTDNDLVRDLKEAWLLEIGSALNSDLPENWIALATRLGLRNEDIEQLRHASNPGYDVLRRWKTRPSTTIRVLLNALNQMRRSDVVDLLQKAKTDPTDVTIVIRYNDQSHALTKGGIPGLTTLLEFVRPQIHSNFSHVLTRGFTCARLMPGSNRCWTSTVSEFTGEQIDIELLPLQHAQIRTVVRSAMELRQRPQPMHVVVGRDGLSYMENDLLIFQVPPPVPPAPSPRTTPRTSLSPTPSLSSIEFENDPGPVVQHPEDDSQSDDFPFSHGHQVVTSVVQGENYSTLPGFHPEIPTDDTRRTKVEEVLRDHLRINGIYILRRTDKVNSVLALSVVFKRTVVHFSIMSSVTNGPRRYFVFNSNSFSSVSELIAFYHSNSLSSMEAMDIDTRGLFLTAPLFSMEDIQRGLYVNSGEVPHR